MKSCEGVVSSLYFGSAVDGPGLRCVVFTAGCNLRCPFCHNPETFEKKGEVYTAESLAQKLLRYKNYIINGGVTISGGEPFLQAGFCVKLIRYLKKEYIHIAVETNASIVDEELIGAADLIIADIKNYNNPKYALNFLRACEKLNKNVHITNVIIPGVNDGKGYLKGLKETLSGFKNITKTDFLPFKKLCIEKYEELNIPFPYRDKNEPGEEEMKKVYDTYCSL